MECQVGYLALFLLFSVIEGFEWFWMESQVWAGASGYYWELFDKPQKTNMQDCYSFTCSFSSTLASLSKCGQLKSFL